MHKLVEWYLRIDRPKYCSERIENNHSLVSKEYAGGRLFEIRMGWGEEAEYSCSRQNLHQPSTTVAALRPCAAPNQVSDTKMMEQAPTP